MNKSWPYITMIVIIAATSILIGYDIIAAFHGQDSTISLVITKLSHTHPIVAFAFGVLMGHFFWQNE